MFVGYKRELLVWSISARVHSFAQCLQSCWLRECSEVILAGFPRRAPPMLLVALGNIGHIPIGEVCVPRVHTRGRCVAGHLWSDECPAISTGSGACAARRCVGCTGGVSTDGVREVSLGRWAGQTTSRVARPLAPLVSDYGQFGHWRTDRCRWGLVLCRLQASGAPPAEVRLNEVGGRDGWAGWIHDNAALSGISLICLVEVYLFGDIFVH